MNLEEKKQVVAQLKDNFAESDIVLVAHYSGLTVEQMTQLRTVAKQKDVSVKVAKNSLIRLAVKDTNFDNLESELSGPTLLIFSNDIVAAAKVLVDFVKENELLVIKNGSYSNSIVGEKEIIQISKMPSLDEIRAKLVSLMNTPATKLACVLKAPALGCARVIKSYSEK